MANEAASDVINIAVRAISSERPMRLIGIAEAIAASSSLRPSPRTA